MGQESSAGCATSARMKSFTTKTRYPQVLIVVSGLVQVSIVRVDGVEVVLEFMGPETICGEGDAFDRLPRISRAVALEETDTIEFDTMRMEKVLRSTRSLPPRCCG